MSRSFVATLLVSAAAVGAQSVEVSNTAANPVPVTVTNTASVTVTNPVQVAGSVQVTNTPAVTISGTPTVLVANQPGTGVGYSENFSLTTGATGGSTAGTAGTTVPIGKRRTIQTVSAAWTCATGKTAQVLLFVGLPAGVPNNGSVFGGQGFVNVPGQFAYSSPGPQDTFTGTLSLNLTMPPQGTLTAIVNTDFNANCQVSIWVFGVEAPDSP